MRSRNSNQSSKPDTFITLYPGKGSNPCGEIIIATGFGGISEGQELWIEILKIEEEWKGK